MPNRSRKIKFRSEKKHFLKGNLITIKFDDRKYKKTRNAKPENFNSYIYRRNVKYILNNARKKIVKGRSRTPSSKNWKSEYKSYLNSSF